MLSCMSYDFVRRVSVDTLHSVYDQMLSESIDSLLTSSTVVILREC